MPDDSAPRVAFELAVLQRLDRIERALLELTIAPAERDLLRQIATVVQDKSFTARELTNLAEINVELRAVIVGAVGSAQATRRVGKLLARAAGHMVAGVHVDRQGESADGAVWRVWAAKLSLPADTASVGGEDIGSNTETWTGT